MPLQLKTKETFLYEIRQMMNEYDLGILEAILKYGEKYGLDENYIANNLMSAGLKEQLQEECEVKHMIKRSVKIDGI